MVKTIHTQHSTLMYRVRTHLHSFDTTADMVNNLMKACAILLYKFINIYTHLSDAFVLRFNDAQGFVLRKTVKIN